MKYTVTQSLWNSFRNIFLLALLLVFCGFAKAQRPTFAWAEEGIVGGSSGSFGSAHMVTDNAGNSYVSGTFYTGYIVFGKDTLYNNGSVSTLYVVKYDPLGNELWALQTDSFERSGGLAIAINTNTNKLYIVGNFIENYNAQSIYVPGHFGNYSSTITTGTFIAQLDNTGKVDWVKEMDTHITVSTITAVGDSIAFAGTFKNTAGSNPNYVFTPVPFGNGITLTGKSNYDLRDIFIAECDSSGKTLWAQQAYQPAGGSIVEASVQSITADHAGNILVLGDYQGALVMGSDSLVSAGVWMYTAKFDKGGDFIWAASNGSVTYSAGTGYNSGTKVVCDENNNVIITGQYFYILTWGHDTLTNLSGNIASFIVKYDANGNELWALDPGATCNSFSGAAAVATDKLNNIYFTMTYEHPFTFDTFSLSPIVGQYGGDRDVFVAKMDSNGHPFWLKSIGGTLEDWAGDITIDTFQNIFICGYFASTDCHFDSIILSSTSSGYSVYSAKIGPSVNPDLVEFTVTDTSICQNSSVTFTDQSTGSPSGWSWTFTGGTPSASNAQNPSVTYKQPGNFAVKLVCTFASGKDSLTKTGYITVKQAPKAGAIVANPDSICAGSLANLSDTGSSAGTIQWQSALTTSGFGNINGANSTGYSDTLNKTNYFRVVVTNAGCADTSAPFTLVVNPIPTPPVLAAVDSIICASDSTRINSSGSYVSYNWNNGDIRPYTYADAAGGYWVSVTDANGCKAVSAHKNIATYPVPSVSITEQGDTLVSYGASSYQWYYDGSPITGATTPVYIALQTGNYALQITDTNGCATLSNNTFVSTGINEIGEIGNLDLYPNPATNTLNIRYTGRYGESFAYEILDVLGQKAKDGTLINGKTTIVEVQQLPRGIYLIQINNGVQILSRKVLLQ